MTIHESATGSFFILVEPEVAVAGIIVEMEMKKGKRNIHKGRARQTDDFIF